MLSTNFFGAETFYHVCTLEMQERDTSSKEMQLFCLQAQEYIELYIIWLKREKKNLDIKGSI